MGLEDDFLKDDLDDEKTIEYIKNYFYKDHTTGPKSQLLQVYPLQGSPYSCCL